MTAKETIDILNESCLWNALSFEEKVEALAYAMERCGEMPKKD